jgi:RNA polymerase-interacting CarD/CdnL/TRCF family regulator
MFGFAEITGIESKEVAGVATDYYVVQTKKLMLWIPVNSPSQDTLRLPTEKSDFPNLFDILRSHRLPFSVNRNERKFYIHKMLNDGAIQSICSLIRDLSFFRKNNKLNDTDSAIYKSAVGKLLDEWKYSMAVSQEEANTQLNTLLSESYSLSI